MSALSGEDQTSATGSIKYTANGVSVKLDSFQVIEERTSTGNRLLGIKGGIFLLSDSSLVLRSVTSHGILFGANLGGTVLPATFPFDFSGLDTLQGDPLPGSGFGLALNWDGVNTGFRPTSTMGSITITSLTDTTVAGTFAFDQIGDMVTIDSVVVKPNVSLNVTNGSFNIQFPRFVDTGGTVDTTDTNDSLSQGTISFTADGVDVVSNLEVGAVVMATLGSPGEVDYKRLLFLTGGAAFSEGSFLIYQMTSLICMGNNALPATFPMKNSSLDDVSVGFSSGFVRKLDANGTFSAKSVSGAIIVTSLTDSTIAGTFAFEQAGDLVDGNDSVLTSNVTMSITNGFFDVPIVKP